MSLLHLVSGHPIENLSGLVRPGDVVVLMGSAVAAARASRIALSPAEASWFAMADDLAQYGLSASQLANHVTAIDHQRLLELVIQCDRSLSW